MEIKEEIQNYFAPAMKPVKLLLLEGTKTSGEFQAILKINIDEFPEKQLIYDLPPLIRILCQRREVLKKELLEEIDPKEELCLVIDWLENQKRVAIFNLEDNQEMKRNALMKLITEAKDKWNRWFLIAKEGQ
ncbi:MAG: hypothetical protein Fur0010_22110 [Bdellovibrio sp.]